MQEVREKVLISDADNTAVTVRPLLTERDMQGLIDFRNAISGKTQYNFAPHNYTEKTIRAYIERNRAGEDRIYLGWVEDKVIAYFFLWEFDQSIPVLGIGIQDDYHGLGLGKKLMQILLDDAKQAGKTGIQLTVRPDNEPALHLYTSLGFYHSADVEGIVEGGATEVFPELFLPLREGALPIKRKHAPPVL